LSTGQYFATAFLNAQRNSCRVGIGGQIAFGLQSVCRKYCRNGNISTERNTSKTDNQIIGLKTDKDEFLPGEKVEVNIELKQEIEFKNIIVKAS
jgi:hypothetical protein